MAFVNSKASRYTLADQVVHLRWGVHLQVCHNPGQSPTLVFLHGGMGNRFNWRAQYDFFHARGREVLAYDLAGHGQSSPYPRYSIGRHRRDLNVRGHEFCFPSLQIALAYTP